MRLPTMRGVKMMMVMHVHRQVLHIGQYSTTPEKYVNDFAA